MQTRIRRCGRRLRTVIPIPSRVLLDGGANVHARGDEALRRAAENGHADAVRVLLEAWADLHADEEAARRWAAKNGHTETIRVLNEWGAREVGVDPTVLSPAAISR